MNDVKLPTITIATTRRTSTITPNHNGNGSVVVVVVGIMDGLGTGEAACWW